MARHANKSSVLETAPPIVSGRWLLKAVGAVVLLALVCSYLSLALLYYQGQWQIVLHPDARAKKEPAPSGLIHFGTDESGRPQLTGEWHPAAAGSRYSDLTILVLSGGDGSRKSSLDTANSLHELGLNVFDFDYRGYGHSAEMHPSQERMTGDSEAAWRYLTDSRGISGDRIVLYGTGVGASLAARLAQQHPEVQALILDRPHTDLLDLARADDRSSMLPAGLLFHERFALATPLSSLATPKLLISKTGDKQSSAFTSAATPKMTVELPGPDSPLFAQAVSRFLDQYATKR